jgi:hypothetical protein
MSEDFSKISGDPDRINKFFAYTTMGFLSLGILTFLLYLMLSNIPQVAVILLICILCFFTTGVISMIVYMGRNVDASTITSKILVGFKNTWSLWLMLMPIIFIIYLLITNRTRISEGHISDGYYKFVNISILLIMMQVYNIYTSIKKNVEKTKNSNPFAKLSTIHSNIVGCLGVVNMVCSVTLYIILVMFITDG